MLKTEESVFDSEEALELLRLLEAILQPGRDHLLKTALITSFAGLRADEILALDADEAIRQTWLEKFLAYRTQWETACFIAMFNRVLVDEEVRRRLVEWPGGERKLTNFLHLAELLHGAETGQRLTPAALCAWLRKQRTGPGRLDEYQLRLESDGDAVLLATIHKSKGLEYPVVFCPFLWKAATARGAARFFSMTPAADHRLTLDLRSRAEAPGEHDRSPARSAWRNRCASCMWRSPGPRTAAMCTPGISEAARTRRWRMSWEARTRRRRWRNFPQRRPAPSP